MSTADLTPGIGRHRRVFRPRRAFYSCYSKTVPILAGLAIEVIDEAV